MKKRLTFFGILCTLNVYAQTYQAGNTYFGKQNYIEYHAGNLPIIITAPHGGSLEPTTIPDRTCATCTTVMDGNTLELALQIDTALRQTFGCFPHIVLNRLHRKKLDANREIVEAAQGSADAETAWKEWHQYIQAAKNDIVRRYGRGILIDLHGHGHTIQRLELGYLLTDNNLRLSDSIISTPQYRNIASIKNLILNNLNNYNTAQLIRGPFALGTLLGTNNFPSVPSQQDVAPDVADLYFNGGYNTVRHGSSDSTTIDAIQIECNFTGVRNTYDNRKRFATELAKALKVYLGKHYFGSNNFNCATEVIENEVLSVQIYPNPTKEWINLTFENPLKSPILATLSNLKNQIILEKTILISTQKSVLNLPKPISTGLYILTLSDEEGRVLQQMKVVIEE